jgi:DNA primase
MTDRSIIDEIKSKLDIIAVIQEYVPTLKRTGKNYFGLCPFHNEKSPSFSVSEEIQRYKCFGCSESGDVINFIEKVEGIDFPKALELAAKRAGITLEKSKFQNSNSKDTQEKDELLKVNRLVAEYYHFLLTKHPNGQTGRDYATKRQLGEKQLKEFLIGYAPRGYENLKTFLIKRGYKPEKLVEWSLLVQKNGKTYDKFRNRLMFPILNHVGDVVGFSGRVINPDDIPKYLNSSETLVYKKSNVVYGLYQGKESIRKQKKVILVEGNVDVPMAHKFEINNIVAPMGTALTVDQLKLIKRYADEIIFCFDTDQAGEKALMRAFEMSEQIGLYAKVLNLGDYQDLDEMLKAEPEQAFKAIENTESVVENLINRLLKRTKLSTGRLKSEFVNYLAPFVNLVKDKVEQASYVQKIALIVGLDENLIWEEIKLKPTKTKIETELQKFDIAKPAELPSNMDKKELHLIGLLLQNEFLKAKEVDWEVFSGSRLLDTYLHLINAPSLEKGISTLPEEDQQLGTDLVMNSLGSYESDHEIDQDFDKSIKDISKRYYNRKLGAIKRSILEKEQLGEDISQLLGKQQEYLKKLK